jgi:hypothetical protein
MARVAAPAAEEDGSSNLTLKRAEEQLGSNNL